MEKDKKKELLQSLSRSIFGESDSDEEDLLSFKKKAKKQRVVTAEKGQTLQDKESSKNVFVSEQDQAEESPLPANEFDRLLQDMKKGRRRRHSTEKSTEDINRMVRQFLDRMEAAAEDDFQANKEKRPAVNKIKMLSEVEVQLEKKQLHEVFVDHNILDILKKWLQPLADRSLPNVKVRETVLKALGTFPTFETDSLKESGIGKVVMFLWKHPEETRENKKVAKTLIERWSRPIFNLSARYSDLQHHQEEEEVFAVVVRRENKQKRETGNTIDPLAESDKTARTNAKQIQSLHPVIPQRSDFDFKIRPKSQIPDKLNKKKPKPAQQKKFEVIFEKMGGKSKKRKTTSMSIEGRNFDSTIAT